MPCDINLDKAASDSGTQIQTSIVLPSSSLLSPTSDISKQLQMQLEELTEHAESIVHGDHDDVSIGCKDAPVKHVP